jgi:hypothetical protein
VVNSKTTSGLSFTRMDSISSLAIAATRGSHDSMWMSRLALDLSSSLLVERSGAFRRLVTTWEVWRWIHGVGRKRRNAARRPPRARCNHALRAKEGPTTANHTRLEREIAALSRKVATPSWTL